MQKEKCLAEQLKHSFEFIEAREGESIWKCQFCGEFLHEFEDSKT